MQNWLQKITNFFVELVTKALAAILQLIFDVLFWLLDGILSAISALLHLIPAPCCVDTGALTNILSGMPNFAAYVIHHLDISGAFQIIACGVTFYLLRKLFTLGQW